MKRIVNEHYQETYYTETLENGLRVILWQKENYERSFFMMATPLGAMDLQQTDQNGILYSYPAGIAHFLEHKMFEKKDRDVMNEFSSMGANVNAFTSYNETAYYFSTSSDIERPLNLLLDFVQQLDITEASVEKEKGIIVSELNMYLQMSDARLLMELYKSLYHEHPLKYDIGGDEQSVRSITKQQLDTCYERNYHPSTMMLIGISGKDPQKIMDVIRSNQNRKQFAPLCNIRRKAVVEAESVARERFTFEMDISIPKTAVAYKLCPAKDVKERLRQEWCLRLAQDLYFSSLAPEYQEWLDQGIISDYVGADVDFGEDYGVIMFYTETAKYVEFENLIDKVCTQIRNAQINEEQLRQLKHRYYGQAVRTLNSFDDIAIGYVRSTFAGYDYFEGMDMINSIHAEDIIDVLRQLDLSNKAVVTIVPKNTLSDSNL